MTETAQHPAQLLLPRYALLAVLTSATIFSALAAGPLALITGAPAVWAFIRLASAYGHLRRLGSHVPAWQGLLPVLAAIVGFVFPALGYLEIVGSHPATRADWPRWLWVLIPASAIGPAFPNGFVFFLLIFINVSLWLALLPGVAALCDLLIDHSRHRRAA